MEGSRAASEGDQARAEFPMEPLGSEDPELNQPQVPAEERRPESSESSPRLAPVAKEVADEGQDLSGEKKLPSPRPAPLRPPSLGYGAFRRQASVGPEPPSPSLTAAEQSRDGEAPGSELVPKAASGEPAPGSWTPVELQVDVRVKPVGAAGGSRAPSPAPSTRFLTVPVPESPAFSRHTSPALPFPRLTPSPGSTWSRGVPLAAAGAERGLDAEGRAESPGSPTCRCRCKEDAALLPRAEMDRDKKLPRVVRLLGLPMYLRSLHWALAVMAVFLAVSTVAVVVLASKDFLSRYPVTNYSWVGARRGPQGWHWIDGSPLPPQLLPEKDQDEPDLDCGGLEKGKLVALDCSSPRPWVCAKGTK
ncbi:killer cell lectin-like receptor subfamily G member 2 isoform X3 [Camelus dromedarius]|uniref:killer cell lectin-like receptor subfamily G member 2 isoform X3 n=1 Tax=Camelus dromedarius TaxID=9838 RepID=UPI003119A65A